MIRPMTFLIPIRGWLTALCVGAFLGVPCRGASPEPAFPALPGAPASPADGSARAPGLPGETSGAPKPVPALPGTKSPAAVFRELLRMSPSERAQALADRTEHQRAYLEDRVREYQALSPDTREARLQELDLGYHLPPLMKLAPANRAERLQFVPPELRPIVDERLRQWDQLPHAMQQSVLEHESTANYFVRAPEARNPGAEQTNASIPLPPSLPAAKSRRISDRFNDFVTLAPEEQQKALDVLPPAERDQMERTLNQFAKLPPEQRRICVESFAKFHQMSKEERDQFLKNAARWKAMTPRERDTWRALINILPPDGGVSAPPPLPGGAESANRPPITASNTTSVPGQRR